MIENRWTFNVLHNVSKAQIMHENQLNRLHNEISSYMILHINGSCLCDIIARH